MHNPLPQKLRNPFPYESGRVRREYLRVHSILIKASKAYLMIINVRSMTINMIIQLKIICIYKAWFMLMQSKCSVSNLNRLNMMYWYVTYHEQLFIQVQQFLTQAVT